jgi:hypothetical protein
MYEYLSIEFDWHSAYYLANRREQRTSRADIFNEKLNQKAANGWEFVSYTLAYDATGVIVFKRERGSYR